MINVPLKQVRFTRSVVVAPGHSDDVIHLGDSPSATKGLEATYVGNGIVFRLSDSEVFVPSGVVESMVPESPTEAADWSGMRGPGRPKKQ